MVFALSILGMTLLSGCVSTLFESPPSETVSSCDAHWVGTWEAHPADKKTETDDKIVLSIGPDCKTLGYTENGKAQHDLDGAVLVFAQVKDDKIAALKSNIDKIDATAKSGPWEIGYHYFSYTETDNEIRLRQVDDDRVARLIVDNKLQGRTEKISRSPGPHQTPEAGSLHNFVAGTAQEMTHAIETYPLFSDKGGIIFKRIPADPVAK